MRIHAFLKTSLYRGASKKPDLKANVLEVLGDAEHRDGGLDLRVTELRDERGRVVEAPFERIFLPAGKIDYYVIDAE